MAAMIEPPEARPDWQAAAGASSLDGAQDATRDALERAQLAAAVQAAPGLGLVLQDAAAHVEGPGVPAGGAVPHPAVLGPGDAGGQLILAQEMAVPGGALGAPGAAAPRASDLAAMRRVAGLLGLAEAGRATGAALGQHYLGEEGLAARRIGELVGHEQVSPWSEQGQAIGEAVGAPSLWSALRGTGQTEYANELLSLKAGREVDFRTLAPGDLAALIEAPWPDAAGIARHAEALAAPEIPRADVEGLPDQSDELRELGRLGGFGEGVAIDQGGVEGLPDQREEIERLTRPGDLVPPALPDTTVEGLDVLPEELQGPLVVEARTQAELNDAITNLSSGDRRAAIIEAQRGYAADHGWTRARDLERLNQGQGYDIFVDDEGQIRSGDQLHGHWELHDRRGRHQGATGLDGETLPGRAGQRDPSGQHDIRVR